MQVLMCFSGNTQATVKLERASNKSRRTDEVFYRVSIISRHISAESPPDTALERYQAKNRHQRLLPRTANDDCVNLPAPHFNRVFTLGTLNFLHHKSTRIRRYSKEHHTLLLLYIYPDINSCKHLITVNSKQAE